MIKLFVVDDHYMVIEGLRTILEAEHGITWMGHASNAEACMAWLKNNDPDIILADISLPGKSGIELCKEIHDRFPLIKVIALSTFNQASYINKMMENGACGYLLKNASKDEMLDAFAAVMKGKTYLSFEVATSIKNNKPTDVPMLTRREKEVLELVAEGCTNAEIAEKLFISVTTVDSHRKHLLSKLQAKNTAALVKIALSHKLISLEEPGTGGL